jgi:bZIP-type transcription factor MBZ1
VNENTDLRAQNRALMEENKRLSDLTRMLLSSPSFSNFLDNLSASAMTTPQAETAAKPEPQQHRQIPKDVNPAAYAAATQVQRQQIGMTMIPEQPMDMAMLNLQTDSFNYQPQVFALLETPEMPASIETSLLSGKESNFVGEQFDSDDEKVELPSIERRKISAPASPEEPPFNAEFESDPEFALFHSVPSSDDTPTASNPSPEDIFGGIEPEKVLARYELVDASEEERANIITSARIERLADRLAPIMERLDALTLN